MPSALTINSPISTGSWRSRSWFSRIDLLAAVVCLVTALSSLACAAESAPDPSASPLPEICRDQTYGLCTGAKCTVYNGVAYCACQVKEGDSLSKALSANGLNVCQVNAAGPDNGYIVSTFSEPTSIVAPSGDQALYNCPRTSTGSYASCDGGICFTSTKEFPGGQPPPSSSQIVCSCPITTPDLATVTLGHQIIGPYPCQTSFFQYCDAAIANSNTGSTIYAAAATGAVRLNTLLLTGTRPRFQVCNPPLGQ